MLSIQTSFTSEVDDADAAVREICAQLDIAAPGHQRLGILACHNDFMVSGAAQAVCRALPFPVVGANTTCSMTNAGAGEAQLSLVVFSGGGDIAFSTVLSEPVADNHEACVTALCREAAERTPGRTPAMAFVFSPVLPDFSEQRLVSLLDRELRGLPLFGTLACNYEEGKLVDTKIIAETAAHGDRFTVAFVYGDVRPEFHFSTLTDEWILGRDARVTRARDNILMEIDDQPAARYFEALGIALADMSRTHAAPIVFTVPHQTAPISVAAHDLTPEGYLVCGSEVPVDADVAFGAQDWRAVMGTAKTLLDAIETGEPHAGVLFYSCLSRALALELDNMAEIDLVRRHMAGRAPCMLAYSGGEICPSPRNGRLGNTFTACVFRRT